MRIEAAIDDRELWEVASEMLAEHGDRVGNFLVRRLDALSAAGDSEGVKVWLDLGERLRRLVPPTDPAKLH